MDGAQCSATFRCMVAGASLADLRGGASAGAGDGRAPTSLVIGLGGGALPMALCRMFPGMKVLAVEIDPEVAVVAQEHFGLKESDSLKVQLAARPRIGVCCRVRSDSGSSSAFGE